MSTATASTNGTATNIAEVVADINEQHHLCVSAAGTALYHAIECGRLLATAKTVVGHGDWTAWIAQNFAGSHRTAQVYLRLHKHRDALAAKAQSSAVLSLEAAMRLIARPAPALWPVFDAGKPLKEFERERERASSALVEWRNRVAKRLESPELTLHQAITLADKATEVCNGWAEFNLRCQRFVGDYLRLHQTDALPRVEDAERDTLATMIAGMGGSE